MGIYIPANCNQNVFRWSGNTNKCNKTCNGSEKSKANASQTLDTFRKEADARTYLEMVQDKIQDLYEKIKNGETETSYAIGGQSFTEREWNQLLENFDKIEECIRKGIEEELEKRKEREERDEEIQEKIQDKLEEQERRERLDMLTMNQISFGCIESGEEIQYVIGFDQYGMKCIKKGCQQYVWKIPFKKEKEYKKMSEYIKNASGFIEGEQFRKEEFWYSILEEKDG